MPAVLEAPIAYDSRTESESKGEKRTMHKPSASPTEQCRAVETDPNAYRIIRPPSVIPLSGFLEDLSFADCLFDVYHNNLCAYSLKKKSRSAVNT